MTMKDRRRRAQQIDQVALKQSGDSGARKQILNNYVAVVSFLRAADNMFRSNSSSGSRMIYLLFPLNRLSLVWRNQ